MATGDITAVEILSNGWQAQITIEGFVDGGSYDFGFTGSDPSGANIVFTVVSEGYTTAGALSTVTRTVYAVPDRLCGALRKAYPDSTTNHATHAPDETESGGNLIVKVALSDFIYNDDKNGGAGTSGTDVTVSIAAGWYTDDGAGGSTSGNNAATGLTVTNSSTQDYPKVIAQWDHIAGAAFGDRVQSAFQMACNAFHRHGIACVVFDADGQTSSNNETEAVTGQTATLRSATGLYAPAFQSSSVALTNFTQAELIDLRFRAYPVVGDADSIIDTNNYTTGNDVCVGRNKATIVCDKSAALDVEKYVSTSGNDTTGDGTTGNPYATIVKALQDGANIVYLKAGTHVLGDYGTRPTTKNEWAIIQPEAGQSSSTVTVKPGGAPSTDYSHVQVKGCTITVDATGDRWVGSASDFDCFRCVDCVFDRGAVGDASAPTFYLLRTFIENCTGDLGPLWKIEGSGTALTEHSLDGVRVKGDIQNTNRIVCCTGNAGNSSAFIKAKNASYTGPNNDNAIYGFNAAYEIGSTGAPGVDFDLPLTEGLAIVGNVLEKNSGTQALVNGPSDDVASVNVLIHHNTFVGERQNIAYNSTGTAAVYHLLWSMKGNLWHEYNNKGDLFVTENANRIGGWSVEYMVGSVGNNCGDINFQPSFVGLHGSIGTQATYTDDQSTVGEGGGGGGEGDYRATSNESFTWAGGQFEQCDLTGRSRSGTTIYNGALLPVPDPPTSLAQV